jgi:hypothetical protein|nr:MAG TPA: C2H2 type zinc-finger protein [Caudoviricetes sp.]
MFENLKIRNTTKCDCGRQFVITDIEKLQRIEDKHFYSGVVKDYSKAHCPNCGKEVILLLKQAGQTYEVINVAEEDKNVMSDNENNINNVKNVQINTTMEDKPKNISNNEIICPECKKTFKSKSGLTNHMKVHQN